MVSVLEAAAAFVFPEGSATEVIASLGITVPLPVIAVAEIVYTVDETVATDQVTPVAVAAGSCEKSAAVIVAPFMASEKVRVNSTGSALVGVPWPTFLTNEEMVGAVVSRV